MEKIGMGLYWYHITGEKEKEAADYLWERIDFLDHSHLSGEMYLTELADLRRTVSKKYGVIIEVV